MEDGARPPGPASYPLLTYGDGASSHQNRRQGDPITLSLLSTISVGIGQQQLGGSIDGMLSGSPSIFRHIP